VFDFVERTRMSGPAGELYVAELVAPGGGAVLVCGPFGDRAKAQLRGAVPQFHESTERAWPNLSYSITVLVPDVDGHHEHARAEGAQILVVPRVQQWGLRDYEVLDLEGRQWNFSQHLRDRQARRDVVGAPLHEVSALRRQQHRDATIAAQAQQRRVKARFLAIGVVERLPDEQFAPVVGEGERTVHAG